MANSKGTTPKMKILPCPNPSYKPPTLQNLVLEQIQDSRLAKMPHHPHVAGFPGVSTRFATNRHIATTGLPPPLIREQPPKQNLKFDPRLPSKPGPLLPRSKAPESYPINTKQPLSKKVKSPPNVIVSNLSQPPVHPKFPRPVDPNVSKPIDFQNQK